MAEYIEREGLMKELGPYKENNFSQEMSVILQIVAETLCRHRLPRRW